MSKILCLCMFLVMCGIAFVASAAVTVEDHLLQKGRFVDPQCKPDTSDPATDACACEADIHYPVIKGMADAKAQDFINAALRKKAEDSQCKGIAAKAEKKKDQAEPYAFSLQYEVTFHSPPMLGMVLKSDGYTGGAHGDSSVEGVTIDTDKGKMLSAADIFAAKDMPAVNDAIYDALSAKPEGEVFHAQIDSLKGAFMVGNQCDGCTLTLMPDGVHVVFDSYKVAPYSEGNPQVLIPVQYVSYPAVVQALTEKK